jgi:hypothetical protein
MILQTFTIKKDKHRPNPWQRIKQFAIWRNKKSMERIILFDITAKYELPIADQDDVNKLFGIGYLPGGHHKDSVRFGWNWNNETGRVRLFSYCYVNGERKIYELCEVINYHAWLLSIDVIGDVYSLTVRDALNTYYVVGGCDVPFTHKKKLSYALGLFFGGNNAAPHDVNIKMKRK